MTYEINGKKYLLIIRRMTNNDKIRKLQSLIQKHRCIIQDMEEYSLGLLTPCVKVSILVPEDCIFSFIDSEE